VALPIDTTIQRSRCPSLALGDHRLERILQRILEESPPAAVTGWTYALWCRGLQYPELRERGVHQATKQRAAERDEALAVPAVRWLVEWAGSRRRSEPAAAAAAALVTVGRAVARSHGRPVNVVALARRIYAAIDSAVPLPVPVGKQPRLLAHPERLADPARERPPAEHPRLTLFVEALLRLADAEVSVTLVARATAAVSQTADWWKAHARPAPAGPGAPHLPGVVPAHLLWSEERLSAHVSDSALLPLVAGPRPGQLRPCQAEWRRGLTFWTAACLASGAVERPPASTLKWWRAQIATLSIGKHRSAPRSMLSCRRGGGVDPRAGRSAQASRPGRPGRVLGRPSRHAAVLASGESVSRQSSPPINRASGGGMGEGSRASNARREPRHVGADGGDGAMT
jgi:hypothetical protein